MVHPDYRRRGIMESLLARCHEMMPVLYAKGTLPAMHRLRMKAGFRPIKPDTFLVCLLAPVRFLVGKLGLSGRKGCLDRELVEGEGYFTPVVRFGAEFDELFERVAPGYPGLVARDAAGMNWRYIDHPLKEYLALYCREGDRIVACAVLRAAGRTAHIIDLVWDWSRPQEPRSSIRRIKRLLKKGGFAKLVCLGTLSEFRNGLKAEGFMDRKETPRITAKAPPPLMTRLSVPGKIHLVDGDGDSEFL
jgi:hypothetical protein